MNALITPDEVPRWIPGRLTLDSTPLGWEETVLKGYRYDSLDVEIPTMRDFMIVVYRGGVAEMSRRSGGPWQSARVEPGVVSILTRAEQSRWRWDKAIDVDLPPLTVPTDWRSPGLKVNRSFVSAHCQQHRQRAGGAAGRIVPAGCVPDCCAA